MPVTIAEIGPGRGTMMKDIIRTVGKLEPDLAAGASFALVEASPQLASRAEGGTLEAQGPTLAWYDTIDALPAGPLLIVGNELFDAVPFRQFVRHDGRWSERCVGSTTPVPFLRRGPALLDPDAAAAEAADGAAEGASSKSRRPATALMAQIADAPVGAWRRRTVLRLRPSPSRASATRSRRSGSTDTKAFSTIPARPTSPRMSTLQRLPLRHDRRALQAQLATQGDFLVRHGAARARRPPGRRP